MVMSIFDDDLVTNEKSFPDQTVIGSYLYSKTNELLSELGEGSSIDEIYDEGAERIQIKIQRYINDRIYSIIHYINHYIPLVIKGIDFNVDYLSMHLDDESKILSIIGYFYVHYYNPDDFPSKSSSKSYQYATEFDKFAHIIQPFDIKLKEI